jgi:hypothetical protein
MALISTKQLHEARQAFMLADIELWESLNKLQDLCVNKASQEEIFAARTEVVVNGLLAGKYKYIGRELEDQFKEQQI